MSSSNDEETYGTDDGEHLHGALKLAMVLNQTRQNDVFIHTFFVFVIHSWLKRPYPSLMSEECSSRGLVT